MIKAGRITFMALKEGLLIIRKLRYSIIEGNRLGTNLRIRLFTLFNIIRWMVFILIMVVLRHRYSKSIRRSLLEWRMGSLFILMKKHSKGISLILKRKLVIGLLKLQIVIPTLFSFI